MSASQLTDGTMAEFQKNVTARVQTELGTLLPEKMLSDLILRAIEETFFKKRVEVQSWGAPKEKPSWFIEEVSKAAEPMLRDAIAKWIADNHETVNAEIQKFLDTQSLAVLTSKHLNGELVTLLQAMHQRMMNR